MSAATRFRTLLALGPASLARVGLYRIGLRTGLHPAQRITAAPIAGPFFAPVQAPDDLPPANRSWDGRLRWFDWFEIENPGDVPPDWFANPFVDMPTQRAEHPWWQVPDFASGDIKGIWELSRFSWLAVFATEAAHGDEAALARINDWLSGWIEHNPFYRGPNWKCGQEASIRVMHLLLAALMLKQDKAPTPGLVALVAAHLQRIAPTMSYAIGQQNNHGTSEAAGLFVGGEFLARAGDARGARWSGLGRRWLENRARRLIEPDGGFSQYSITYHRLMLDTYSFAEAWRRRHGLPAFSDTLRARLAAATYWLHAMVDGVTGDAPNVGANDGARLLPLTDTGYRDFRPSLQLGAALWLDRRAVEAPGPWDEPGLWLGIGRPEKVLPPARSQSFDDSGYHVMRAGPAMAMLRYPRFRYRPAQADALHLDLWVSGRNLLRDAGSYSYNAGDAATWFAGTGAHNTASFDGRDQMPRLGRFLFGDWLTSEDVVPAKDDARGAHAAAGYRDQRGAGHHRSITLRPDGLTCDDHLSGSFGQAVLRWRLAPGDYRLEGNRLTGDGISLSFAAEGAGLSLALTQAPESLHYFQQHDIPVLEARVDGPCRLLTEMRF